AAMKSHPHDLLLQELVMSRTGEPQDILDHLVVCATCRNRLRSLMQVHPSGLADKIILLDQRRTEPRSYEPVLDSVSRSVQSLESMYAQERAEAIQLFAELAHHPAERRTLIVRNSTRFHTWGLCELLLWRSQEQNFLNAALGESLALLALEILDHLSSEDYRMEPIEDMRARAWAYVGNSRISSM